MRLRARRRTRDNTEKKRRKRTGCGTTRNGMYLETKKSVGPTALGNGRSMSLSVLEALEKLARLPQCYLFITGPGQHKGRYRVGRLTVEHRDGTRGSFYELGSRAPSFQVRDVDGWEVAQEEPLVISESGELGARATFYSELPTIGPLAVLLTSDNLRNHVGKLVCIYARNPRRGVIDSQIGRLAHGTESPSGADLWRLSNLDDPSLLTSGLRTEDIYAVALVAETDLAPQAESADPATR
jgi:hypothetical protein